MSPKHELIVTWLNPTVLPDPLGPWDLQITARIKIFWSKAAETDGSYFTEPCQKKKRLNSLDKIETCHGAVLVLTHELVFICSYFSPMLPPFCFWNSMYRKVLEKKASVDGSATVLSLCFSLLISSIKSWITVFVICGIPFSKKYKYLKMVKVWGFTQADIFYKPENK